MIKKSKYERERKKNAQSDFIFSLQDLFTAYLANMSHESALIRRSSAACLIVICRHSRQPMINARYLITIAIGRTNNVDRRIHSIF